MRPGADMDAAGQAQRPVLLVHGIWDRGTIFAALVRRLRGEGRAHVEAIDLAPRDASVPLEVYAGQVEEAAARLLARAGVRQLDLVGFSMGALVSRLWLVERGGRARTRSFVSISGPQRGTALARLGLGPGTAQMRPGSALLRRLEADPVGLGAVRVTSIWTPFDLMILPPRSGVLPGGAERRIPVPLHALMPRSPRVIAAVLEAIG